MAQFDTGQAIVQHIMRRAGEILPTATSEADADHLIEAKLYAQAAYWEICALKPWRWARKRAQFNSVAQVTGSVTTISGADVTLSATVASSLAGRKFMLDAETIPHRILTHTAGTADVVLQTDYTGTATSGTYTVYDDEFTAASDILAFPVISDMHSWGNIQVIPEGEMARRFSRNTFGNTHAAYAAFISDTEVRIVPWTTEARLFEISYNYRPDPLTFDGTALTDTPILPRDSRVAIAQRALLKIYSDKRDERTEMLQVEFDETLSRMSSTESTFVKPRIHIAPNFRVG